MVESEQGERAMTNHIQGCECAQCGGSPLLKAARRVVEAWDDPGGANDTLLIPAIQALRAALPEEEPKPCPTCGMTIGKPRESEPFYLDDEPAPPAVTREEVEG